MKQCVLRRAAPADQSRARLTAKIPKLVRCGVVLCWVGSNPLLHRFPLRVSATRCQRLSTHCVEWRVTRSDEREDSTPRRMNREKKACQNGNSGKGKSQPAATPSHTRPPAKKCPTSSSFYPRTWPARRSSRSIRPARPCKVFPWRYQPPYQYTSDRLRRFPAEDVKHFFAFFPGFHSRRQ